MRIGTLFLFSMMLFFGSMLNRVGNRIWVCQLWDRSCL